MAKSILILKASKDICGNEIGLIQHHCQLLGMDVKVEEIHSEAGLIKIVEKYASEEPIQYWNLSTVFRPQKVVFSPKKKPRRFLFRASFSSDPAGICT